MQHEAAQLQTRTATAEDTALILAFIQKLALYEKRPQDVRATEEALRRELFEKGRAEVLLAFWQGKAVGYALYYTTFASFSGNSNLYLEDLFIDTTQRGRGLGKELLRRVARRAVEMGCDGLRWGCLRWNEPSIQFYESLGAVQDDSHLMFALDGTALTSLMGQ